MDLAPLQCLSDARACSRLPPILHADPGIQTCPLMHHVLQALARMFEPVMGWMATRYQAAVATELKKYGLRYEDLYDPELNMVSSAHQGC